MIFNAANYDRLEALIVRDSGHVRPELGLEFFRKTLLALLGAEDQVDAVAAIGCLLYTSRCV